MNHNRLPLHERLDLVRSIAIVLGNKSGSHASAYWRGLAKRLLRLSMALGATSDAAVVEVRKLLDVVLREIVKRDLAIEQ